MTEWLGVTEWRGVNGKGGGTEQGGARGRGVDSCPLCRPENMTGYRLKHISRLDWMFVFLLNSLEIKTIATDVWINFLTPMHCAEQLHRHMKH